MQKKEKAKRMQPSIPNPEQNLVCRRPQMCGLGNPMSCQSCYGSERYLWYLDDARTVHLRSDAWLRRI